MYGARSYSAPESANSGVKVVPSSTTSGMVPPAIDVEILSWTSAQGMNSTSTSKPCSSAKAELAASKNPVWSEFVPSMIQTVSVSVSEMSSLPSRQLAPPQPMDCTTY